jgi:hypothetical protein
MKAASALALVLLASCLPVSTPGGRAAREIRAWQILNLPTPAERIEAWNALVAETPDSEKYLTR